MPESDKPLLKANYLEIAAPGEYQDLLVVECDPNEVLYIRDVVISFDYSALTDPKPMINVSINGQPFIKNHRFIAMSGSLGWGGHLKLWNHKKPIIIQVKTTAAGTLYATAYVVGLRVAKSEEEE